MGTAIPLGLMFGTALGLTVLDNLALGIALGLAIGVASAAFLRQQNEP